MYKKQAVFDQVQVNCLILNYYNKLISSPIFEAKLLKTLILISKDIHVIIRLAQVNEAFNEIYN